jgi:hypothetical protein
VAARRLLILMLAVLAVSTLAAALLAPPPESERTTTTTAEAPQEDANERRTGSGRLIEARVRATGRRPERIRASTGDQLALTVRSRSAGQVEIPAFGLIEDLGRADPARFDLLVDRPGVFEIRVAGAGRIVGRIVVRDAGRGGEKKRGRSRS